MPLKDDIFHNNKIDWNGYTTRDQKSGGRFEDIGRKKIKKAISNAAMDIAANEYLKRLRRSTLSRSMAGNAMLDSVLIHSLDIFCRDGLQLSCS